MVGGARRRWRAGGEGRCGEGSHPVARAAPCQAGGTCETLGNSGAHGGRGADPAGLRPVWLFGRKTCPADAALPMCVGGAGTSGRCGERKRHLGGRTCSPSPPACGASGADRTVCANAVRMYSATGFGGRRAPPPPRIRLKSEKMRGRYSVLNECPQEHDLVTFGLLILNPEPMRLSM